MPMRFALWVDGVRIADQELDPSLGAGFEPGEQELSGRRVEFRIRLYAGDHWIAGTPLQPVRRAAGEVRGPRALDAAAAPAAGVQAAAGHDGGADRVRQEALRGPPERADGGEHTAGRRHRDHRALRRRRLAVGREPRPDLRLHAEWDPGRGLPHQDPRDAGAPRLPPAGHRRRGRAPRPARRGRRGRDRLVRGRADLGHPGGARLAGLPLPRRARRAEADDLAARAADGAPDAARAGDAALVLPLGEHARRRPARRRRSRRAAPAGRAGGAGEADARGSALGHAGRALRRPVAPGAGARIGFTRSREVPRLRSLPADVDAAARRSSSWPRSSARIGASSTSSTGASPS